MNFRLLLASIVLLLVTSCTVTLKQEDITPAPPSAGIISVRAAKGATGLLYALPKTGLRFKVEAEKVERSRGDFYQYSERFLGLQEVILQDAVEWRIKNVSLASYGVANPNELFQVVWKDGMEMPLLSLTTDGVISAINTVEANEKNKDVETIVFSDGLTDVPYTEEMLLANSTAKMAQEAARYIYRLRERRTALLGAEVDALPPDGEAYALSLQKIDQLERQFLSLFKGTEKITSVTEYVEIVPSQIIEKDVLFRFSSFAGVVDKDDLSGSPVFVKMKMSGAAPTATVLSSDTVGVFFKRPAAVNVQVLDGTNEVLSDEVMMGQFGSLQALPAHAIDSKVKVSFYPENGAIKAIAQ